MHSFVRALIVSATLIVLVAACSGGGASPSPEAATPEPPTPSAAPASEAPMSEAPMSEAPASAAPAGAVTVAVAASDLGQILVDGSGRTLYLFKSDTAGESVCYDECETNWPPLTADGTVTVGDGLDAAQFTTVARTDGSMQVKLGAWPLYYFAGDSAAGDTNGQGLGSVWFVVSPSGDAIE